MNFCGSAQCERFLWTCGRDDDDGEDDDEGQSPDDGHVCV